MATATDLHRPKTGWGVLRLSPWHLAGVFEVSGDAEAKLSELGPGYTIRYGDVVPETDKFLSADPGGL